MQELQVTVANMNQAQASQGKKGSRKLKYVHLDADGHYSLTLRKGVYRANTYYKRGKGLVESARKLHVLTGCHVEVKVLPTWDRGTNHYYQSPGFPMASPANNHLQSDHCYGSPAPSYQYLHFFQAQAQAGQPSSPQMQLVQLTPRAGQITSPRAGQTTSPRAGQITSPRQANSARLEEGNEKCPRRSKKCKYVHVDADGRFDLSLRTGVSRTNTYHKRGKGLVESARKLHLLTGCHVEVCVLPAWERGRSHYYRSPSFPDDSYLLASSSGSYSQTTQYIHIVKAEPETPLSPEMLETPDVPDIPEVLPASSQMGDIFEPFSPESPESESPETPEQAAPGLPVVQQDNTYICGVCQIQFESESDTLRSHWMNCASGKCDYWVHACCVGVSYPFTELGKRSLQTWVKAHFLCPKHIPK